MRKLVILVLVLAMTLSTSSIQVKAETVNKESNNTILCNGMVVEFDYNDVTYNDDGTITYGVLNADEIAETFGIEDAKDVKYTLPKIKEEVSVKQSRRFYGYTFIQTFRRNAYSNYPFAVQTAHNDSDLVVEKEITLSGTVANEYGKSLENGFTIDAAEVSYNVGFNVTDSWTVSDVTKVTLQPKQSIQILAYENFADIGYNLYLGSYYVGICEVLEYLGFVTITR